MNINATFSERLQFIRTKKNLTQAQVADDLKVSRQSIGYYEKGERIPDIETASKIAQYFNVSVDYLLGRTLGTTFEIDDIIRRTGLDEESIRILNTYLLGDRIGLSAAVELRVINAIIKERDLLNALVYYLYHRLDKGLFYTHYPENSDEDEKQKVNSVKIQFYIEDSMNAEEDMQALTFIRVDENNMKHFLKLELDNELDKLYEKIHKMGDENGKHT